MRLTSFEMIAEALDSGGVLYLVAGGLAVNAHGVLRFTKDLDVVVQLIPENIARAFAALESLGIARPCLSQWPNFPIRPSGNRGWRKKACRCCNSGVTHIAKRR